MTGVDTHSEPSPIWPDSVSIRMEALIARLSEFADGRIRGWAAAHYGM
jgi:hypothetical protein